MQERHLVTPVTSQHCCGVYGEVLGPAGVRVEHLEAVLGLCIGRCFLQLQALTWLSGEAFSTMGSFLPPVTAVSHFYFFLCPVLYSFKGGNLKDLRALAQNLLNK